MRTLIARLAKTLFAAAIMIGFFAITPDSAVSQSDQRAFQSQSRYKYVETKPKTEPQPGLQTRRTSDLARPTTPTQTRGQLAPILESEDAPTLKYENETQRFGRLQPVQDMATLPGEYRHPSRGEFAQDQAPLSQPKRSSQATFTQQRYEPNQAFGRQYDTNDTYGQSQYEFSQPSFETQRQSDLYREDSGTGYLDRYPAPAQRFPFRDQYNAFQRPFDYPNKLSQPYRSASQGAIFGIDKSQCCNEWANFCECKDLDFGCNCGGLKANPGHLGLKFLGSNEACDRTESCSQRGGCGGKNCTRTRPCSGCKAKLRNRSGFSRSSLGSSCDCGSCGK